MRAAGRLSAAGGGARGAPRAARCGQASSRTRRGDCSTPASGARGAAPPRAATRTDAAARPAAFALRPARSSAVESRNSTSERSTTSRCRPAHERVLEGRPQLAGVVQVEPRPASRTTTGAVVLAQLGERRQPQPARFSRSSAVTAAIQARSAVPRSAAATACDPGCMARPPSPAAPAARTSRSPRCSSRASSGPHLRAIYGYCRLVDILGDELEGDRLAALDELEREVTRCYDGEPEWPLMRELQPTIREFALPREPFDRLIEANRMDQRISEYETWADLKGYCVHSADPVGRLVLGVLRRLGRRGVRTPLGRCLHRPPARELPPGRAARPRARADLPAARGPRALRRHASSTGRTRRCAALLEFEAERARGLLARGRAARRAARRPRSGAPSQLFARGGLAALEALERAGLGRLHPAAEAVAGAARARGRARARPMSVGAAYAEVHRVTRREAKSFAYGIMVLPREKRRAIEAIYAFAREVDDIADGDAAGRRQAAPADRSARGARDDRDRLAGGALGPRAGRSRWPTRGAATRSRSTRSTRSSTAASRTSTSSATRTSTSSSATAARSRAPLAWRVSRSTAREGSGAARAGGAARGRAPADQHPPRRGGGQRARPGLPAAGRAGRVRRVARRTSPRAASPTAGAGSPPSRPSARAAGSPTGSACSPSSTAAARSACGTFAGIYARDARRDRGARLRRLRRRGPPLHAREARDRRAGGCSR